VDWPADEHAFTLRTVRDRLARNLRYNGDWPALGWHLAPDTWTERLWGELGQEVIEAMSRASYYEARAQKVPVVAPAGLQVAYAAVIHGTAGITPYPPTDAGWRAFLEAARVSTLKFGELQEAARYWWSRSVPRNLLSADGGEGEEAEGMAEAAK
jgi:hypothetical protein